MKNLVVLRRGMKSELVGDWQAFLRNLKLYMSTVDDDFGPKTDAATRQFQEKHKLTPDGIVGPLTWAKAVSMGFHLAIPDPRAPTWHSLDFPQKPSFPPLVSNAQREKVFGKIEFVPHPAPQNPEGIRIVNGYEKENIVMVLLPQLEKATNGKYRGMRFHRTCQDQLTRFFEEIESEGLLHLIRTYAGAYYPRFVRGSRTVLSNHSYGTAFDINAAWNGLGRTPALVGQTGSVRELVPLAHKWGFYWGGHFSRPDGMHFEIAKVL